MTRIPDFSTLGWTASSPSSPAAAGWEGDPRSSASPWIPFPSATLRRGMTQENARDDTPSGPAEPWLTPEGIPVKGSYGPEDRAGLDFLDTYPGLPPFLRGPYPTMYVNQSWTVRQYAGFS